MSKRLQLLGAVWVCLNLNSVWADNALDGWVDGAADFHAIIDHARQEQKPVIAYFYTDWCGWCKKLNADYFSSEKFQLYLRRFSRVQINPEKSAAGMALFANFGRRGFPSVFVFLPGSGEKPESMQPFKRTGSWTPEQYQAHISDYVARTYNQWGYRLAQAKRYQAARGHFAQALAFEAANETALYLTAWALHSEGNERRDEQLLCAAESHYRRLLALAPGHAQATHGLKALERR